MPAATMKAPAVSRRGSTVAAATVDPEVDPEVCVVSEHACPAFIIIMRCSMLKEYCTLGRWELSLASGWQCHCWRHS